MLQFSEQGILCFPMIGGGGTRENLKDNLQEFKISKINK